METTYYAPIIYLLLAMIVCMLVFPFIKKRAKRINAIIAKQEDLGDLSVLFHEEVFAKRDLTLAQISAHERQLERKQRRGAKMEEESHSKLEND